MLSDLRWFTPRLVRLGRVAIIQCEAFHRPTNSCHDVSNYTAVRSANRDGQLTSRCFLSVARRTITAGRSTRELEGADRIRAAPNRSASEHRYHRRACRSCPPRRHAFPTANVTSTSTVAPSGSSAVPIAARACLPDSPKISTSSSLAPLATLCWSLNPSCDAT